MAILHDVNNLGYSSSIEITNAEDNVTSMKLTSAIALTGSLSGYVYDTLLTGNVVANALVVLYNSTNKIANKVYTDAKGYYSINNIAAGVYSLTASKDGYVPAQGIAVTIAVLPIVQNIVLLKSTQLGYSIYGIVSKATDSLPITGATIKVVDSQDKLVAITESISDGEFSVTELSNGTYKLIVSATGYTSVDKSITISDRSEKSDISMAANSTPANKATISGYITTNLDVPIANAWVGLYSVTAGTSETLVATTHTNVLGYYIFGGIDPGNYIIKSKSTSSV